MGSLDPRRMLIIPITTWRRDLYLDREDIRGREKALDGKSIIRAAAFEWAIRPDHSRLKEDFDEVFAELVVRQMDIRKPGFRNSEGAERLAEKLKTDLRTVQIRITMALHDETYFEVGVPPMLPKELDHMLGNRPCGKCGLFILSGTWTPHTDFECNEKIVRDLMSK